MENKKLFEKIEEKYSQKYGVSWYTSGYGEKYIRIKDDYFDIFIPQNAKNKDGILINTFDNVYYYTVIESIINAVNRIIKKSLSDENDK